MAVYLMPPKTDPSWYVTRYRIRKGTANYMSLKLRRFKLLHSNKQCEPRRSEDGPQAQCFYETWLLEKVLRPFNCTLFYLVGRVASHYGICRPEEVVAKYAALINQTLDVSQVRRFTLEACYQRYFVPFRKGSVSCSGWGPGGVGQVIPWDELSMR